MKRDLLTIAELSPADAARIFSLAKTLKSALKAHRPHRRLEGHALAMIFEKPSLRTRVTFEIGIAQLGGSSVYLAPNDIRLGERESVGDIARNLSRWAHMIVARTFSHDTVRELAAAASVPVINGLSDWTHPCQVLADCFTLLERGKRLDRLTIAYVGDGNNVVHSLIFASMLLGFRLRVACPRGFEPDARVVEQARDGRLQITHSVEEAVAGADVLYTDVWTSMGQEAEAARRRQAFRGYRIDAPTLRLAKPGALVMHCLPAHRGEEITDEVLDGPQSIVLDQAENRLHVQKAIMVWLAESGRARTQGRRGRLRLVKGAPRRARAAVGRRRRMSR